MVLRVRRMIEFGSGAVTFSPAGDEFVVTRRGGVVVIDVESGEEKWKLKQLVRPAMGRKGDMEPMGSWNLAHYLPCGRFTMLANNSGDLIVVSMAARRCVAYRKHSADNDQAAYAFVPSPDGTRGVSFGDDGVARVWDLRAFSGADDDSPLLDPSETDMLLGDEGMPPVAELKTQRSYVFTVHFPRGDSSHVWLGCSLGTVQMWDIDNLQMKLAAQVHEASTVCGLHWFGPQRTLLMGCFDGHLYQIDWDPAAPFEESSVLDPTQRRQVKALGDTPTAPPTGFTVGKWFNSFVMLDSGLLVSPHIPHVLCAPPRLCMREHILSLLCAVHSPDSALCRHWLSSPICEPQTLAIIISLLTGRDVRKVVLPPTAGRSPVE